LLVHVHANEHQFAHSQWTARAGGSTVTTYDEQHVAGPQTDPAARPAPPIWRKSTASNFQGNCVELAVLADGSVAVRNSRVPTGPQITNTRAEMAAFVQGVQAGEFNDLLC
jgi:hypothetical protein